MLEYVLYMPSAIMFYCQIVLLLIHVSSRLLVASGPQNGVQLNIDRHPGQKAEEGGV